MGSTACRANADRPAGKRFAKVRRHVDAVRQAWTSSEPLGCGRCHVSRRLRPQIVTSYDNDSQTDLGSHSGLGYSRNDLGTPFDSATTGRSSSRWWVSGTATDLLDTGVKEILDRIRGEGRIVMTTTNIR